MTNFDSYIKELEQELLALKTRVERFTSDMPTAISSVNITIPLYNNGGVVTPEKLIKIVAAAPDNEPIIATYGIEKPQQGFQGRELDVSESVQSDSSKEFVFWLWGNQDDLDNLNAGRTVEHTYRIEITATAAINLEVTEIPNR